MHSKTSPLDLKALSVMGIINTTPDSFSDGGHFQTHDKALLHAHRLIDEGADILDIGGESTRPGAEDVSVEEEISRTIPLIESIRAFSDIPISIDTSKAEVMRAASAAGVNMINDVWALRREGAMQAAVDSGLPVCLMHMQGSPDTMQQNPDYDSVVKEVKRFLHDRLFAAQAAGIKKSNLIIDPGFGFGKTLDQNYQILKALPEFVEMGYPLLVGMSRKSMVGLVLDKPLNERVYGSISAAVISAMQGAHIIRVHDVTETRQALTIVHKLKQTTVDY
jgi:dihydropteroate synthase